MQSSSVSTIFVVQHQQQSERRSTLHWAIRFVISQSVPPELFALHNMVTESDVLSHLNFFYTTGLGCFVTLASQPRYHCDPRTSQLSLPFSQRILSLLFFGAHISAEFLEVFLCCVSLLVSCEVFEPSLTPIVKSLLLHSRSSVFGLRNQTFCAISS